MFKQITRAVVTPSKPTMRHTAERVLSKVINELEIVKELLFELDNSEAIVSLQRGSHGDVRIAALSLSLEGGSVVLLLRLLTVRYLTQEHLRRLSHERIPVKRPRSASTEKFIKEMGLPPS
jgi:hypothetical protein